jgi:hypothetical protein
MKCVLKDLQFASHIIDELLREENNGKASR